MKIIKLTLVFLVAMGNLSCNKILAQLPDFMERLDGGKVQSGNFYEKIPFELEDNRIYINSVINDDEYRFLLDSYSPCLLYEYVVLKTDIATIDKTKLLGNAFANTFLKPIYPLMDSISIGHVKFFEIGAMVMTKDSLNPMRNWNLDGIIGSNMMKNCIWQLNFFDTTITLTDNISKCKYISGAIQIPFSPKPIQGSPDIILMVGNDSINAEFDTGNNGFINVLSPSILNMINEGKVVEWSIKKEFLIDKNTSDSIETHYYIRLDSMQFNQWTLYDLPVVAYNPIYINTMNKGSVGIDFMKHYIITIDWIENKIYLYPIEHYQLPDNKKTFGFTYKYLNNKYQINSVFKGSEAERLGISIGDEIISINNTDLTNISEDSTKNILSNGLFFSNNVDPEIDLIIKKNNKSVRYKLCSYYLFDFK